MSDPKQLDQFIDDLHNGNIMTPQNTDEVFVVDMVQLANQFDLSPEFDSALISQIEPENPALSFLSQRWVRLTASLVFGIVGISLLIITVPPLRVLAGEILNELFPRDTESIKVYSSGEDRFAYSGDDTIYLSSPSDFKYVLDYDVKLPDIDEAQYVFEQAIIVRPRNTIQSYFRQVMPDDNPSGNVEVRSDMVIHTASEFFRLNIKQQPLVDSANGVFYYNNEQDTIAPIAETTPVSVAGYQGEFVQGDWFTSTISGQKHFYWKADAPVYRIRWQDETFLYEVELWSDPENVFDEILTIAESMMD